MENVIVFIEELSATNDEDIVIPNKIYSSIANLNIRNVDVEVLQNVVPRIYDLFMVGKLKRDIFFISLLINPEILNYFLIYEKSTLKLKLKDPQSIFDYTYYNNNHWLLQIVDELNEYEDNFLDNNRIILLLLKLVLVTNTNDLNLDEVTACLERKYDNIDKFWQVYIENLNSVVKTLTFIKKHTTNNDTQVFTFLCDNTLLDTFSQYIDVSNSNHWDDILRMLIDNEDFNKKHFNCSNGDNSSYNPIEVFTAFAILTNTINCLKRSKKITIENANEDVITSTLEIVKASLIGLKNKQLQIEVLENIFALIFLRDDDFDSNKSHSFFCTESEIRLILSLLKSVFEEVKKQSSDRSSTEFKRFVVLDQYVADGYWRLELLTSARNWTFISDNRLGKKDVLYYMLASPEGLINMCMKKNNVEKAIQVVKIFALEETSLAKEIEYSIAISDLRRNVEKLNISKSEQPSATAIIDDHFTSFRSLIPTEKSNTVSHFPNPKVIDTLDILITLPLNILISTQLMEIIEDEHVDEMLPKFFIRWKSLEYDTYFSFNEAILSSSSSEISKFETELKPFTKLIEFYNTFQSNMNKSEPGILNFNHPIHKIMMDMQEACIAFTSGDGEKNQYLQKLLKYLKGFYRILSLEQNNTDLVAEGRDVSLFEILNYERVDLMSKLIYERHIDGADFDHIFGKMKMDLCYHIAACSFPNVRLNTENTYSQDVQLFKPRKDVVNYIHKRNWLLGFMINKIHDIKDEKIDSNEIRIRTLGNLMKLKDTQNLKVLFGDSDILTVLQQDFYSYLTNEREPTFIAEICHPNLLKAGNWRRIYELVSSIYETKSDGSILKFRDLILCNLIKERAEVDFYKYVRFITNNNVRVQIILEEFYHWPVEFCIDIISSELCSNEMTHELSDLMDWCKRIELYSAMTKLYDSYTWYEIYHICQTNKEDVLKKALEIFELDMLIDFLDIHSLNDTLLQNITPDYFLSLFDRQCPLSKIELLLTKLPYGHRLSICKELLKLLKDLDDLKSILNHFKGMYYVDDLNIENIEISLKIISCLIPEEQLPVLCLLQDPLSILEILLMNTRLEKFSEVLNVIEGNIKNNNDRHDALSKHKIDQLLRTYAEKSLDFKIITRPASSDQTESRIMESIDSLYLEKQTFIMPENIPTKEQWVSDNTVSECMCCTQIMFSMFNRRHHCRRCGRVICWNCSLHTMQIETYGDILVRVCKDCHQQLRANASESGSAMSERSRYDYYWVLTDNYENNKIARDEFSYENAPSVLLCLSILKYHSKSDLCPRFLLNQCDNILKLLHPSEIYYAEEIDFSLILKMLKSLAIAAKMISNECNLQWGASLADKIISEAEMLGLLATRGYLYLIAESSRSQSIQIDTNVLRLVRDKLLELEQWHLALEVSTKAGLDISVVFAKWGKSFLKAGNLQFARMKFRLCFEKIETTDYTNLYESVSSLRSTRLLQRSRLSLISDSKTQKNPLLLNEIVQILESKTEKLSPKVLKNLPNTQVLYESTSSLHSNPNMSIKGEDSVSIINKLQSLTAIANGNYTTICDTNVDCDKITEPHLENIYYNECVYYLERYGSTLSLCQFYIRHNDFKEALDCIIENHISEETFMEIYMSCLKHGRIDSLHEGMIKIDSTFEVWKGYIKYMCVHLEKQSMLHSLYQLQQFVGDFIRAAMTCIKFYCHEVTSFGEFANRVQYLYNAEEHLKQDIEQEQWVDVQSVNSTLTTGTFEEKSITNPALVMKLDSRDIQKHINTISRQIEVVNFLSRCEKFGKPNMDILDDIQFPKHTSNLRKKFNLPTLFGTIYEKIQLAILCIVCGENVDDGFGIAYRIMQDYHLKAVKVYCQAGRLLAKAQRHSSVPHLVNCIKSSGERDAVVTEMCDEMLVLTAKTLADQNATDKQLEDIIKHIEDKTTRINTFIETKQLRSAFLIAAKFNKTGDVRRIIREAESQNRPDVKKLCIRYLVQQEQQSLSKSDSN